MANFTLTGKPVSFADLSQIISQNPVLEWADEVLANREDSAAEAHTEVAVQYLQAQLVSYGPELPENITRLALLLNLQLAAAGHLPAVKAPVLQRLLAYYNREVTPVVFSEGSDAAKAAQLYLPLVLAGNVRFQGYTLKAADVADIFSWQSLPLSPREAGELLRFPVFSWARVLKALTELRPLTNWIIFLDAAFAQLLPQEQPSLHQALRQLVQDLEDTQHQLMALINKPGAAEVAAYSTGLTHLSLVMSAAVQQLADLNVTLMNELEAMLEPPLTQTFALAADLNASIKLKNTPCPELKEATLPDDLVIAGLERQLADLTHLANFSFWGFLQTDHHSGHFPESSTLSTYKEAGLFVPTETVHEQLAKISNFIQSHIPVGAT